MREPGTRADTDPDPVDRKMKLDSLKDRIARAEYAIDPDVVAEALIRRVCAERASAPTVSRRDARSRAAGAARRPR
jgi:hypothetical protein